MRVIGLGVVLALGGVACSSDSDDSGEGSDATTLDEEALADTASEASVPADTAGGIVANGAADTDGRGVGELGPLQLGDPLAGRDIAVEARATLRSGDVRAAVDGVTATVLAQGGMVASATVDYAPELTPEDGRAQATIVVKVPPDALDGVVSRLSDFGTVTGFEQLAEDVTERLTDLDTRIANQRESITRLRGLLAEAANVDILLEVEARLTDAELELEQLLAGERNLDARVQLSTLTVDIVAVVAGELDATLELETGKPGVVEALASGWATFVGVLFTIVLVLAAGAPFIVLLLGAVLMALVVRRVFSRRRPPRSPTLTSSDEQPADVSASRPG